MNPNTLPKYGLNLRTLSCLVLFLIAGFQLSSAQHAVDAAFLSPHNGKIYMFRGDEYIRVDTTTMTCDPGYPLNISFGWGLTLPSGWEGNWDAIVPRNNGTNTVLIFKGNLFLEWDIDNSSFLGPYAYSAFGNLPASFGNVTAAYASSIIDGFWLFDEDEYVLIDAFSYGSSANNTIASQYGTLYPEDFKQIDASFALPHNDQLVYIRGTQQANFTIGTSTVFAQSAVDTEFSSWPFTDAVLPFANGTCDLDAQLTDIECGNRQLIPVLVDNLSFSTNTLGLDCSLASVEIHVLHEYASDVEISLISPGGVEVELSTDNGGSSQDYGTGCLTSTVFTMTASTSITAASAPFTSGPYVPEGDFSDFLNGTAAEGKWLLKICDDGTNDFGTLEYVKLNFAAYTPVGISDEKISNELVAYPNPSTGIVMVKLPQNDQNGILSVTDLSGRTLFQTTTNAQQTSLDLSEQPAGMYFLNFQNNDGSRTASRRLTIQR